MLNRVSVHYSIAAQEGDGEEDERHTQRHFAAKEGAVDAASDAAALVAAVDEQEQRGSSSDGQIAQKQFRKLPVLSGLPKCEDERAQPLPIEHHVDGLDGSAGWVVVRGRWIRWIGMGRNVVDGHSSVNYYHSHRVLF